MTHGTVYRWFDSLGNENVRHIDESDFEVHQELIDNIISHRDLHLMTNEDLRLRVTVHERYWVSYNMLQDNDFFRVWRLHKN
jgi:hypothetical protein